MADCSGAGLDQWPGHESISLGREAGLRKFRTHPFQGRRSSLYVVTGDRAPIHPQSCLPVTLNELFYFDHIEIFHNSSDAVFCYGVRLLIGRAFFQDVFTAEKSCSRFVQYDGSAASNVARQKPISAAPSLHTNLGMMCGELSGIPFALLAIFDNL